MEHFSLSDDEHFPIQRDEPKQALLTQLSQETKIHHIDDVFLRLTQAIVNHFGVQVAQVWAMQATTAGQFFPQLRSMMCQDLSLSQNIVVNTHVVTLVGRLLRERRNAQLHPVDVYFTQYLAILLKRHGLHYCTGAFISGDTLLPPPNMNSAGQKIATPLATGLLLFLQHMPHQDVLPSVEDILIQTLEIASARGLLLVDSAHKATIQHEAKSPRSEKPLLPPPSELIARRVEDPMSNPISAAMALPEEPMRRVYAVINDKRNIAELARLSGLSQKDVFLVTRKLAAIQRIQLYTSTGQHVENLSSFEM